MSSCFIKGKTSIGRAEPTGQQVPPSLAAYQRPALSPPTSPPPTHNPGTPRAADGNADKHRVLAETKGRPDSATGAVNVWRHCRRSALVHGTSLPSLCSLQPWTDAKKEEAKEFCFVNLNLTCAVPLRSWILCIYLFITAIRFRPVPVYLALDISDQHFARRC